MTENTCIICKVHIIYTIKPLRSVVSHMNTEIILGYTEIIIRLYEYRIDFRSYEYPLHTSNV